MRQAVSTTMMGGMEAPLPMRSLVLLLLPSLLSAVSAQTPGCALTMKSGKPSEREALLLARLEPLRGTTLVSSYQSDDDVYNYTLRVCDSVAGAPATAGLVQRDAKGAQTVVGRINETHLIGGLDWILLIYKGGEAYDSHCHSEKRKAMVMISCDPYKLASQLTIVSEEREKDADCFYLFEMSSSVACNDQGSGLGAGAIIFIVLLVLIAVYLLGGFLYQRFVVGAKGAEQIPNYHFWQNLGNILADGCDFVCRSKPKNQAAAYRGVGTGADGDGAEEEEERDDHLLPM
uniref:Cation-dependent mannose-6-phosphate receptor n=2 Tax=Petromyzon marinus TaxID=7757 RepID=A0AAJ7X7P6_PETMA|nr:cation-dependent mannose-6-phosphate receptor [Petromyzon marinus]